MTGNCGFEVSLDFFPSVFQEYLENCSIADCSQMELTNVSMSRSVVNMADLGYRKVVTALSHHAAYGEATVVDLRQLVVECMGSASACLCILLFPFIV